MHSVIDITLEDKSPDEKGLRFSFGDICALAINQITYEMDSQGRSSDNDTAFKRTMMGYLYNRTVKTKI